MIIEIDESKETTTRSSLLNRQYNGIDNFMSATDMVASRNYSFRDEINEESLEATNGISRITFFGHTAGPNKFGMFETPEKFVEFLESILHDPTNARYLENLQTIDLFGCEVGRRIDGQSFVGDVAKILSEKGYGFGVRAFSHPETDLYSKTLLFNQASWSYLGLDHEQAERYLEFKGRLKQIENEIVKTKARIPNGEEVIRKLNRGITALKRQMDEIDPSTGSENSAQYSELSEKLTALETRLTKATEKLPAVSEEVSALVPELQAQFTATERELQSFLQTVSIIIPETVTPRETLDGLPHCRFESTGTASLAISSQRQAETKSSVREVTHSFSGAVDAQEMKDEFASLREEGKKAEEGDKKTSSRGGPSLGGSEEET